MEAQRRYQGRELPRPDEELVDQGLGFDLGTLFDRRRVCAKAPFYSRSASETARQLSW